jgi:hypothetical protein
MNYPQRATLRVVGVLLFLSALFFSYFMMPYAMDIRMADNICNFGIDVAGQNFKLGQFAQNVLEMRGDCTKVHFLRLGIDYSWIFLVLGAISFFVGVWATLGAKGNKEIWGSNKWGCDYCKRDFNTEEEAEKHELTCKKSHRKK